MGIKTRKVLAFKYAPQDVMNDDIIKLINNYYCTYHTTTVSTRKAQSKKALNPQSSVSLQKGVLAPAKKDGATQEKTPLCAK